MIQDDKKLVLLRHAEFFHGVDTSEMQLIAEQMTEQSYADGDVVVREGDPGDRMYLLVTGTMHVYVERDSKIITYSRLQAGECFGEMALIDGAPRSATVQAETPSFCLTLSKEAFLDLLQQHPQVALRIMKDMILRLRGTNVQLQD